MKHFKHNIDKKINRNLIRQKKTHHNREHCFHMKKILCVQNILKIKLNLIKKQAAKKKPDLYNSNFH